MRWQQWGGSVQREPLMCNREEQLWLKVSPSHRGRNTSPGFLQGADSTRAVHYSHQTPHSPRFWYVQISKGYRAKEQFVWYCHLLCLSLLTNMFLLGFCLKIAKCSIKAGAKVSSFKLRRAAQLFLSPKPTFLLHEPSNLTIFYNPRDKKGQLYWWNHCFSKALPRRSEMNLLLIMSRVKAHHLPRQRKIQSPSALR